MSLSLHTAATAAVLTTAEAKLHLRVDPDITADDALINTLVASATQQAEHLMGRAILPQKWRLSLDDWPRCQVLKLARPIVTAVDTVKYVDTAGALQTLAPGAYFLTGGDLGAELVPAYGTSWPASRCQPGAVEVVFSCGWADPAAVPDLIKAWIKLRLAAMYVYRAGWTQGQAIERNEHIDFMLDRWRVFAL